MQYRQSVPAVTRSHCSSGMWLHKIRRARVLGEREDEGGGGHKQRYGHGSGPQHIHNSSCREPEWVFGYETLSQMDLYEDCQRHRKTPSPTITSKRCIIYPLLQAFSAAILARVNTIAGVSRLRLPLFVGDAQSWGAVVSPGPLTA